MELLQGDLLELHCAKRVRSRSYSSPHFSRIFPHLDWIWTDTTYLLIFPYSVQMR